MTAPPPAPSRSDCRPETDLLLASCSDGTDCELASRLRVALEQRIDWDLFAQMVAFHEIAPLAYRNLETGGLDRVPLAARLAMRMLLADSASRAAYLVQELVDVLDLFWSHGIPAVSYKDPLMAAAAYGSAGWRTYHDLDILLRKRDLAAAGQLLLNRGYHHFPGKGALISRLFRCDRQFETIAPPVVVELHWRVMPVYLCRRLGAWRYVEAVLFDHRVALRFTAEEQLLILCAHEAKHSWFRLKGVCDVVALIRASPGMDWSHVLSRARQRGVHRIVLVVLYLGHDLFGSSLPGAVLEVIAADAEAARLGADLRNQLVGRGLPHRPRLYWAHLLHIRCRERVLHKALGVLRLSFRVHEKEPACFPVPGTMSAFYYATWPIRLFAKYGPLRPLLVQRWRAAQ